jgi:hypothetical protein
MTYKTHTCPGLDSYRPEIVKLEGLIGQVCVVDFRLKIRLL